MCILEPGPLREDQVPINRIPSRPNLYSVLVPLVLSLVVLLVSCEAEGPKTADGQHSTPANQQAPVLFPVKMNDKWGYIDKVGHLTIQPQFDAANEFYDGLAAVCAGKCRETEIQFKNGSVELAHSEGKWGFINQTGRMVINPRFDLVDDFFEGLAAVCIGKCDYMPLPGGQWGYIDKSGNYVANPQFRLASPFVQGLAIVDVGDCGEPPEKNCKKGYIDKTGKFAINPQFDSAHIFVNGLAEVELGKGKELRVGYIDKSGKYVWSPVN